MYRHEDVLTKTIYNYQKDKSHAFESKSVVFGQLFGSHAKLLLKRLDKMRKILITAFKTRFCHDVIAVHEEKIGSGESLFPKPGSRGKSKCFAKFPFKCRKTSSGKSGIVWDVPRFHEMVFHHINNRIVFSTVETIEKCDKLAILWRM